ncbi:MAG: TlpA disulfide reductase family protein [Syntrophotaleaceae bacterium]
MKKYYLLPLCLLLLLCFVVPASAYLEVGNEAPDFELAGLDGKKVRLSDFKGQIIVLQLGTTWCPDCVGQSADLMQIGPFLKDQGVVLVDVFIQESSSSVSQFLQDKNFTVQMVPLLDDGQAHRAYQVYLIPRLLIIDQQFRIVHDGLRLKAEEVKSIVTALQLPEKPVLDDSAAENTDCPSEE